MNQNKIWLEELNKAIEEIERKCQSQRDEANWYNNNMPNVGQSLDYMPLPDYPKELNYLKNLRDGVLNETKNEVDKCSKYGEECKKCSRENEIDEYYK